MGLVYFTIPIILGYLIMQVSPHDGIGVLIYIIVLRVLSSKRIRI